MLQKIIYRFFFFFLLKFIHIKFEGFVYSSFLIPLLIIINEILPIIIFLYIHYSIYIYIFICVTFMINFADPWINRFVKDRSPLKAEFQRIT